MTHETKNTELQFHVEKLENRDAPRVSGQLIREADFASWAHYKKEMGQPGRNG